jgi:hypothetical protein
MTLSIDPSDTDNTATPSAVPQFKIPPRVDSLDVIPVELQEQYRQDTDGSYVFTHVKPLKTALEKERKFHAQEKKRANQYEQLVSYALGNLSGNDVDELLAAPDKLDQMLVMQHGSKFKTDDGAATDEKIKMALAVKEQDFAKVQRRLQTELEAAAKERDSYRERYITTTVEQQYQSAIRDLDNGVTLSKLGEKSILLHLREDTYIEPDENGRIHIYVKAPPGSNDEVPYKVNGLGVPMTVKELIEKEYMAQCEEWFLIPTSESGFGVGASRSKPLASTRPMGLGVARRPGDVLVTTPSAIRENKQEALRQLKSGVVLNVKS